MKLKKLLVIPYILAFFCINPMTTSETYNIPETEYSYAITATTDFDEKMVIPGGKSIGVTLGADGIIVSGISEIICSDNKSYSPAHDAGLKTGDVIKTFNNKKLTKVSDLTDELLKNKNQTAAISFIRNGKTVTSKIVPQKSGQDGTYKIGAWVKDAASGIGTLTFYDPKTKYFAALGHGIYNSDSDEVLRISGGEMMNATIVDVKKSEKGNPGELKGVFSESDISLGKITQNSSFGICGKISDDFILKNAPVTTGTRNEVKVGDAYILSNISGEEIQKFNIEIQKIFNRDNGSSKDMIIKIKDPKLIEKTGGIVQGMSGSPIIQNGKLIGAVTHVFVNDPTRGYGIFIENMLTDSSKN